MTNTIVLPPVFLCSSWGDEIRLEEDFADAKYVALKRPEWENEKRKAKADKRFKSWDDWLGWASRIDGKRMEKARSSSKVTQQTELSILMDMHEEYMNVPSIHFRDQKHMDREVKKIEKEILACVGGADALRRRKALYEDDSESEPENSESDSDDDSIDLTRITKY
jgi:hypothetical protein